MNIIDFRLRPPYGDFLKNTVTIYNQDFSEPFAKKYGAKIPASAVNKSMELCLEEMDQINIVKGVVPIRVCQGGNNLNMQELFEAYPERFIGMAGLPTDDIGQALAFIDEFILEGIYTGAFIEPGFGADGNFGVYEGAKYANDESLFPIYEKCQEQQISILISHGGFTVPDHSYNDPIYIDYVARTFPDLKIILGHGSWPYASQACFMAMLRENVYLSPDLYMINSFGQYDYTMAANYRLQDKIIFGSAYPVIALDMAVKHYKNILRPEVWEDIFYNNALRALNLMK